MADDSDQPTEPTDEHAKQASDPAVTDTNPDADTDTSESATSDLSVRDTNPDDPDAGRGSHVGDADVLAQERLLTLYEAGSISREEFIQKTGSAPEDFDSALSEGAESDVTPSENTIDRQPVTEPADGTAADSAPADAADGGGVEGGVDVMDGEHAAEFTDDGEGSMPVRLSDEPEDADPSDYDGDADVVAETQQEAAQNRATREESAPSSIEEVNELRAERGLDPIGVNTDADTDAEGDSGNTTTPASDGFGEQGFGEGSYGGDPDTADEGQPLAEDRVAQRQERAGDDGDTPDPNRDPTPGGGDGGDDELRSRLSPKAEERGYTDDRPVEDVDDLQDPAEAEAELQEPMNVPNDDDVDEEELRDALEEAGVDPQASPMSDLDDDLPENFDFEGQDFEEHLGGGNEPGAVVHKELNGIVFRFVMPDDDVVYDILEHAIADPDLSLQERNNYVIQRVVQRPDFTPQEWAEETSPIERGIIASEAIDFAGIDKLGNYLAA